MGGFFGAISHKNCIYDVFFGTDYHSHLGTRRAGLAFYDTEKGFQRQIHSIENTPFRTKFDDDMAYQGNNQFRLTVCVTVILKVLAQVEILIPSYGFCTVPPCEEFAENVCDEFFSLPLFPPASLCNNNDVELKNAACNQGSCGGCGCGCGCNR